MIKKFFCHIFAVVFFLLLFCNISYAGFSDTDNHWAVEQIKKGADNGIVTGYPDGTFKPDKKITRAEFITVINHIFNSQEKSDGHFLDVSSKDWFHEEIEKALAEGFITGYSDGTVRPNNYITRQEAVKVIAAAFGFSEEVSGSYTRFSDSNEIQDWAKDSIGVLFDKGYIEGFENGIFCPNQYMTRAQTMCVLNRAVGDIYTQVDNKTVQGNLMVRAALPELKNISIDGDLILTPGIGNDGMLIENITVKGKIYIKNSKLKSISISSAKAGKILIDSHSTKLHIIIGGNAAIEKLTVNSQAEVDINNKSILKDIVLKACTALNISKDSSVNNILLMSGAAGSAIQTNQGVKIKNDSDKVIVNGVPVDRGTEFTVSEELELLNVL